MEETIHLLAAEDYYQIAEEKNTIYEQEKVAQKRIALRVVAAQNYFYASINFLEAVLATLKEHSYNHENRLSKVLERRLILGEEIVQLYFLIERDQRNKVTYRGENGEKYDNIRKLARLLHQKDGK